MKATHKPTVVTVGFQRVSLDPGQFVFGRNKAAQDLKFTVSQVRTCLNTLKTTNNLTIRTTNKFSIISVVNWDVYQTEHIGSDQLNTQQKDQQVTSNRPASNHIQEAKEAKKVYGEFQNVLLSEDEHAKLIAKFNSTTEDKIESLSLYLESSGKKYKSHYASILNFARRYGDTQTQGKPKPDYESMGYVG